MARTTLALTRIASLLLSFAFGVIGMGVGINALVKFNHQKRQLKGAAPAGATVNIDASDVLDSGYVLTVVCGLIALSSAIFLFPIFLAPALAGRTLKLQGGVLGFLSVWLFATLVPFTDFFANHSAKVTAFLGSFEIPQSTIQQVVASLGATTQYRHVDYRASFLCHLLCLWRSCSAVRLSAILPWFAFLFGLTSAVLSFLESRGARRHSHAYPVSSSGVDREDVKEKDAAQVGQTAV